MCDNLQGTSLPLSTFNFPSHSFNAHLITTSSTSFESFDPTKSKRTLTFHLHHCGKCVHPYWSKFPLSCFIQIELKLSHRWCLPSLNNLQFHTSSVQAFYLPTNKIIKYKPLKFPTFQQPSDQGVSNTHENLIHCPYFLFQNKNKKFQRSSSSKQTKI